MKLASPYLRIRKSMVKRNSYKILRPFYILIRGEKKEGNKQISLMDEFTTAKAKLKCQILSMKQNYMFY